MTPHHRRTMLAALVLLLMVISGCGGPPLPAGNQPPAPAPDTAALIAAKASGVSCPTIPTEAGEVVYEGVGVRTYPAPTGTPARLTIKEALTGSTVTSWGLGSSRGAELRLVTTGDFGCTSQPTGVVRKAGWVVTIHNTIPLQGGPPNRLPPPPTVTCYSVVIVDAQTSELLLNLQTCGEDTAVRAPHSG